MYKRTINRLHSLVVRACVVSMITLIHQKPKMELITENKP